MKRTAAIVRNHVPRNAPKDVADVITQCRFVGHVLHDLGWSVIEIELGSDLGEVVATLQGIRPDVVFNLVESIMDSDELANLAPTLFRKLRLSYTGADSTALFMTNDKVCAKRQLASVGLPTPEGADEIGLRRGRFPGPGRYIVKSRCGHASLGLDDNSVAHANNADELLAALAEQARKTGGACMAERFIAGREFSVSLLEAAHGTCKALGTAEIKFLEGLAVQIVGYDAKWAEGSVADTSTVRSFAFHKTEAALARRLEQVAQECWEEMGLSGYARVDFRVDEQERIYVIDVNANPCLAEDAGFMATAREAGWKNTEVVSAIVEGALSRHVEQRPGR